MSAILKLWNALIASAAVIVIVVIAFSLLVLGYDTVWGADGRPAWITGGRTYPFVNAASDEMVQLIKLRRERMRQEDPSAHDDN